MAEDNDPALLAWMKQDIDGVLGEDLLLHTILLEGIAAQLYVQNSGGQPAGWWHLIPRAERDAWRQRAREKVKGADT